MTKDYYQILEVSEFSTQEEIKKAYKKLVRSCHPDIAGNSIEIVAKFKEINEAYEFLSDSKKRADYDKARRFYSYAGNAKKTEGKTKEQTTAQTDTKKTATSPNFKETFTKEKTNSNQKSQNKSGFSFNWEEIWDKVISPSFLAQKNAQRGNDIYSDIEISVADSINGTVKVVNMLKTHVCPKCGGRKFVNGAICNHCHGKGDVAEYKKFNVKIPAGIKNKSKIRLSGEGEKGVNGGSNGDLYLTIHIIGAKEYQTDGNNVLKTVPITPYEAVLGSNIVIDTPIGKVSLKISPNTQNGQKIRLNGCGLEQYGKAGDMIVTVEIRIPKDLTKEEVSLYKKLQEISSNSVREF